MHDAPGPVRRHLPDERASLTHRFVIAGHKGYLTVGFYPDGRVGEIWLRVDKVGSTVRGFCDAWALMVSTALQYGVPLAKVVEKFKGMKFEPSEHRGGAWSILDHVATRLERWHLPPK